MHAQNKFLEKSFEIFWKIMAISSKRVFCLKNAQWKFLPKVFEKVQWKFLSKVLKKFS